MPDETSTNQSIARALTILELISRNGYMNLTDLYKAMKISKSSLMRMANTLRAYGYLSKNEQTGEYSLTLKLYEVGISAVQNLDKISLINSTLAELSNETGRIAQFSVEDNNQLLCIQSIGQKSAFFSVYTNVGWRSPLYSTSAGKSILSTYPNEQIIEKWESFNVKALTENTHNNVQSLLRDISETRIRCYAVDREENEYNVFCVGAAVVGYAGAPMGAVSISGKSLTNEEEMAIKDILLPAVKRLSGLLGYIAN